MSTDLFERHRETLERAIEALRERTHWSAYPEVPSGRLYGETAKADGEAAFAAACNAPFELGQPGRTGLAGAERSPFGPTLGIAYEQCDVDALVRAAQAAGRAWGRADAETRAGVCLEILARLNRRSFEIANAVMHTTGQAFVMAFQAGGPHAQDRGLEAVACAFEAMRRTPTQATWRKQVGKEEVVVLEKRWRIVPRGVAAVIGCSTFPTWNTYPGLFASLVTGNAAIVKPHPGAVLPLALTVRIARETLAEAGFDPNVVALLVDLPDAPVAERLVTHPDVGIVDYTGGSAFGAWIERHATAPAIHTEKAGVNAIVIESLADLRKAASNIAFTLSLYSGQMCTTSQNILVPRDGIEAGGVRVGFDEVAQAIAGSVDRLLGDPARAVEVLGAIQSEATARRIDEARREARARGRTILRDSAAIAHPAFPDARVRTPLVVALDAGDADLYEREMFGPIAYVVATDDADDALSIAARTARTHGAITGSVYSLRDEFLERAIETLGDAGMSVSCNLVGSIWVNQSAAFSDFHVSGANPAGNATLCDDAFVENRFRLAQSRVLVPATVEAGA